VAGWFTHNGVIGEVLVYGRALDSAEIIVVEQYMKNAWALLAARANGSLLRIVPSARDARPTSARAAPLENLRVGKPSVTAATHKKHDEFAAPVRSPKKAGATVIPRT